MTESMDYAQVNPVALRAAIAPHIAAEQEGRRMQAARLAGYVPRGHAGGADFILIEGAGGWRVPINPRETLADVAVHLQVGVILVVGMRLGCINHALLTAEAIRRDGLTLVGWVANQPGERMTCHEKTWTLCGTCCPPRCWGRSPDIAVFSNCCSGKLGYQRLIGK